MIDKLPNYIKPTFALSVVAGLALGILLLIPYIKVLAIFVFWIIGGAIVYILNRANFIGIFTQKEGVAIGAVSGIISVCAAAVIFLPILFLIHFVLHIKGLYTFFAPTFFTSVYDLFVIIMMVIFLGFINAIFNIGTALISIYVINNYFEKPKEEDIGEFKIDV